MEPRIIQLVRYGEADTISKILEREVPTREIFLHHTGSYLCQFIGLAASKGCVELMERCRERYGVKMKMGTKEGLHAVVGAASRGHDNVIDYLLDPWVRAGRVINGRRHSKKKQLPPGWLQPALHKAIQRQHVSTVKLLLKKGWADVNAHDHEGLRPINVAASLVDKNNREEMQRYNEIINILVLAKVETNYLNPLTDTTPLYDAISLGSREVTKRLLDGGADVFIPCTKTKTTVLHVAAAAGFKKTLHALIDCKNSPNKDPSDFDVQDENGRTPLHAAVYGGHLGCVRILINKGLSLSSATTGKTTVLAAIFEQIPNSVAFLTEILDEQVTTTDKSGNKIDVDFRLLASKHSRDHEHRFPGMDVVVALINGAQNMEHMAILQHPLLKTFLCLKSLPAMPYDVLISFMYSIFAGVLSWQVTHSDSIIKYHTIWSYMPTIYLGGVLLLENLRRTYILRCNMNVDRLNVYLLYVSCCLSVISFFFGGTMLMSSKKYPYNTPTRIYLRSITILCSWINVMLSLIRFPLIGEHSFMFFAVLINIGKVLASFACLITGFALSFSIIFADSNRFDTLWKAFTKTLVMMTGEYEYESLFSSAGHNDSTFGDSTFNNSMVAENDEGPLQIPSIIVFLTFVIVANIALMNLMVGLAVNDIQELLRQGRTRQLMKLAHSAAVAESVSYLTKTWPRKMTMEFKGLSWICFLIPSDVKNALKELALKNLDRDQRRHREPRCDNTQKRLAVVQSSLTDIKSSLEKMALEQKRQNYRIGLLAQRRRTERRRRSM